MCWYLNDTFFLPFALYFHYVLGIPNSVGGLAARHVEIETSHYSRSWLFPRGRVPWTGTESRQLCQTEVAGAGDTEGFQEHVRIEWISEGKSRAEQM